MDFEPIYQAIIADPLNQSYTEKGIMPLYKVSKNAQVVIIGQAPGRKAQETNMVWNDLSGDRLREWLGVTREVFYQSELLAHLPMDFYYPGKGKSGDNPPRKGFAQKWHPLLLKEMPNVKLMILIGSYAQDYYLKGTKEKSLTETVRNFRKFLPPFIPLVHPSPLNYGWIKQNPWFEKEVVPFLQTLINQILNAK